MASLADQIANLANPEPMFKEPDEDFNDGVTDAQVLDRGDDDDDDFVASKSSLRANTTPLLEEIDKKYSGKRTSRKQLGLQVKEDEVPLLDDSDDDFDDENEEDDAIESDSEPHQRDIKQKSRSPRTELPSGSEDEEDAEAESDMEDEEMDEEESEGDDNMEAEEDEKSFSSFSKPSSSEDLQKGSAAKSQLGLWDRLLEGRIKLQKVVQITNQLPQPASWPTFQRAKASGNNVQAAVIEGQKALKDLLDQLVFLQSTLLLQNPETCHLASNQDDNSAESKPKPIVNVDDDEEILSSESDSELTKKPREQIEKPRHTLKRKMKLSDYPEFLAKRHKDFKKYRNATIQKWYDKTQVASGKLSKGFNAFEQSALKQIDQILSDQDRLLKRTQLRRSVYRVLGKPASQPAQQPEPADSDTEQAKEGEISREIMKDYDPEIFDDDDFYHQLLREFIEKKTSDINDPIELSRHWLEIQKLRSKVKKKVDTRASKGRKIRYGIHQKLVNLMTPLEVSTWTDESKNDLFSSLFGKRQQDPNR